MNLFLRFMTAMVLIFSFQAKAAKDTRSETWGERLILLTGIYLHGQLSSFERDHLAFEGVGLSPEMIEEKRKQKKLVSQLLKLVGLKISPFDFQFRDGDDPIFQLRPGEPPRTAVTGPEVDTPIIFNRDIINKPESFGAKEALKLVIHELGHKIKKDSQAQLDRMADLISERFENPEYSVSTKVAVIPELKAKLAILAAPPGESMLNVWPAFNESKVRSNNINFDILNTAKAWIYKEDVSRIDISNQIFPNRFFDASTGHLNESISVEEAMKAKRDSSSIYRESLYQKSSPFLESLDVHAVGNSARITFRGAYERRPLNGDNSLMEAAGLWAEETSFDISFKNQSFQVSKPKYVSYNPNQEVMVFAFSFTDKDENGKKVAKIKGQIRNTMKKSYIDETNDWEFGLKNRVNERIEFIKIKPSMYHQLTPKGNIFFTQTTSEGRALGQIIDFEFTLDGETYKSENLDVTNLRANIMHFGGYYGMGGEDLPVVRFQPTNYNRCQSTFLSVDRP